MKVEMLKSAADPVKTLIRGKVYDLANAEANEFIEIGAARKIKAEDIKQHHTPPSTDPLET